MKDTVLQRIQEVCTPQVIEGEQGIASNSHAHIIHIHNDTTAKIFYSLDSEEEAQSEFDNLQTACSLQDPDLHVPKPQELFLLGTGRELESLGLPHTSIFTTCYNIQNPFVDNKNKETLRETNIYAVLMQRIVGQKLSSMRSTKREQYRDMFQRTLDALRRHCIGERDDFWLNEFIVHEQENLLYVLDWCEKEFDEPISDRSLKSLWREFTH